ncbi:hypothetical protein [Noviherbaspirillum pedocola]|uniref:Uncharacterized protein n=1 Tax=Noviherbaspirillum pedocola TaxID=2801341 RepID=A0A934T2J3_9BURK|nr:hypothetical protein [Noviherbaspirillum pedocola]MBK4737984.1 hypothetical protein [Noviherbaspirillum pedocola]
MNPLLVRLGYASPDGCAGPCSMAVTAVPHQHSLHPRRHGRPFPQFELRKVYAFSHGIREISTE